MRPMSSLSWSSVQLPKFIYSLLPQKTPELHLHYHTYLMSDGIFDKIIRKEIPSTIVYEDDWVFCFRDINPQAPTHILIIPKDKDGLTGISKAEPRHEAVLGKMLVAAAHVAQKEGLGNGYRLVINEGKHGCQEVPHLHIHLLGGSQCTWPPGTHL